MNFKIYTDGGSLNNPGQAAIGFLIYKEDKLLCKYNAPIGIASNNAAEYTALIKALEYFKQNVEYANVDKLTCYADSQLMVRQLNRDYKVKNHDLKPLYKTVLDFVDNLNIEIRFIHVLRERNKEADALVKKALKK